MSREKVAIYGGTFNPIHMGHYQCVHSLLEKLKMNKVVVVPAFQNPLKAMVEGPTARQRFEMVEFALKDFGENVFVDSQEVERKGKSYSIETVKDYSEKHTPKDLHLVIGMDELYKFDQWKDYAGILELCNLVVVSRPGHMMPISKEDLPAGLQSLVSIFDRNFITLTTGTHIEILRMKEVEASSSEIRKRLRTGRGVAAFVDMSVEDYIRKNALYSSLAPKIGDYKDFAEFCANQLFERKAINVKGFDLTGLETPSQFTIVASGTSTRHVQSLGQLVARKVKEEFNVLPESIEGLSEGRWVLLDYGALIVHVFYDYLRMEYNLESLWREGKPLELKDPFLGKVEDS